MTIVVGERVVNWTMVGGGSAAREGGSSSREPNFVLRPWRPRAVYGEGTESTDTRPHGRWQDNGTFSLRIEDGDVGQRFVVRLLVKSLRTYHVRGTHDEDVTSGCFSSLRPWRPQQSVGPRLLQHLTPAHNLPVLVDRGCHA